MMLRAVRSVSRFFKPATKTFSRQASERIRPSGESNGSTFQIFSKSVVAVGAMVSLSAYSITNEEVEAAVPVSRKPIQVMHDERRRRTREIMAGVQNMCIFFWPCQR